MLDIRIIMDKASKRSRGAAYIEFAKQEDIFNALALTGQQLMGQAVLVKASEAEKNVAWEAQQVRRRGNFMQPRRHVERCIILLTAL